MANGGFAVGGSGGALSRATAQIVERQRQQQESEDRRRLREQEEKRQVGFDLLSAAIQRGVPLSKLRGRLDVPSNIFDVMETIQKESQKQEKQEEEQKGLLKSVQERAALPGSGAGPSGAPSEERQNLLGRAIQEALVAGGPEIQGRLKQAIEQGITQREQERVEDKRATDRAIKVSAARVREETADPLIQAQRLQNLREAVRKQVLAEKGIISDQFGLFDISTGRAAALNQEDIERINETVRKRVKEELKHTPRKATQKDVDKAERILTKQLGRNPSPPEISNYLIDRNIIP